MHNLLLVLVLIQAQLIIMLKIMLSFPARKLLQLNSITALLSRKHMDISFDRALKQTMDSKMPTIPPDVPLSLLPNVMPSLMSSLEQHGAILQLPPKPEFEAIKVTANTISLEWKCLLKASLWIAPSLTPFTAMPMLQQSLKSGLA